MKLRRVLPGIGPALLLALGASVALAQGGLFSGTWQLDLHQSDFGPEPRPISRTLTITQDTPAMLAWQMSTVMPGRNGPRTVTETWSGPEDGRFQLIQGPPMQVYASFRRDRDGMLARENMGRASYVNHITLSENGTTMRERISGIDGAGHRVDETLVWHRQP